jgi:hypothetical protein
MAKGKKDDRKKDTRSEEGLPEKPFRYGKDDLARSVLITAYDAFQRGDMVGARKLAQAALDGKLGKGDEKAAVELAKELSIEGHSIMENPSAVAIELISRTKVPPKPYLFVAAVGATFLGLVLLAVFRY